MEKLNISKGFKHKFSGRPDVSFIHRMDSHTLALSAQGLSYIRPKVLVKEGDRVNTGMPLFCDKQDPDLVYVSPGTGLVKQIRFGERRRLIEIIIERAASDEFAAFDPVSLQDLDNRTAEDLAGRLKQGGVWQGMRQLPFRDTADASQTPPMIIVCLDGEDLFSPRPGLLLDLFEEEFLYGLSLLDKFSDRVLVTVREGHLDLPEKVTEKITHVVPDHYPAWDPGVVLYHTKTDPSENSAWMIRADHLIMMARFLMTGTYPVEKLIAVHQGGDARPHILTRQGFPLHLLCRGITPGTLAVTGRFKGRILSPDEHLGFFDDGITLLDARETSEMFGFIRPGINKPTVSRTFLSRVFNRPIDPDATRHGEERACISCSHCEAVCPNDLMPNFIAKAILADDVEQALSLGLLDCCQCGLCAYACPSKIELTGILSRGMDAHYKDRS